MTSTTESTTASARRTSAPRTELWFARSSQGYRGKGAKPHGYEHHTLTATPAGVVVESEVVFSNYGLHHYRVRSDSTKCASSYDYRGGEVRVEARGEGGVWTAKIHHECDETDVAFQVPEGAGVLPSLVARFAPLYEASSPDPFRYVPVPEDAFPRWRPPRSNSWFPVMGAARESLIGPRTLVARGVEIQMKVKGRPEWTRYDHVSDGGTVRSTTWLDEEGSVVAYEQPGCVLRATTEDAARALDPRT